MSADMGRDYRIQSSQKMLYSLSVRELVLYWEVISVFFLKSTICYMGHGGRLW